MALEGGEWSAACPGHTLPPGKTRYPFYRRLGGPQGRSGRAENLVPTGIWSRTVQPVVTELPGPLSRWRADPNSSDSVSKSDLQPAGQTWPRLALAGYRDRDFTWFSSLQGKCQAVRRRRSTARLPQRYGGLNFRNRATLGSEPQTFIQQFFISPSKGRIAICIIICMTILKTFNQYGTSVSVSALPLYLLGYSVTAQQCVSHTWMA